MTCKDCIHYKVCKIIDMAGIWEKAELCESFKAANLVVELPCEVGDTVYYPFAGKIFKKKIACFNHYGNGVTAAFFNVQLTESCEIKDFGKIVFLTRAEAEKALEAAK